MSERPEAYRYPLGLGVITALHEDSWEVDIQAEDGGLIENALVLSTTFPEESNVKDKRRPQWAEYGHSSALHGRPVCWPIPSHRMGDRFPRAGLVHYDEFLNFRITGTRAGVLEVRNTLGETVIRLRLIEQDGIVRIDVGGESSEHASIIVTDSDKSIQALCDGNLTASAKGNAKVHADGNVEVSAGQNATVSAGADLDVTAVNITINASGALVLKGASIDLDEA